MARAVFASPGLDRRFFRPIRAVAALACAALCLAACGDGVGQPIQKAVVPLPEGGDVPGSTYCQDVATWSTSDAAVEQQLVSAIVALRMSGLPCQGGGFGVPSPSPSPLPSLGSSPELRCSARRHARDMAERGYIGPTTPEGEGPETRMRLAGYSSSVFLEANVKDQVDVGAALGALYQSPSGDCEALVDPRVVAIGVGKFESAWTVDLAGARAP